MSPEVRLGVRETKNQVQDTVLYQDQGQNVGISMHFSASLVDYPLRFHPAQEVALEPWGVKIWRLGHPGIYC